MKLLIEIEELENSIGEKTGKFNISGNVQCKDEKEYDILSKTLNFCGCPCIDENGVYDTFYFKEDVLKKELKEEKNIIKKIYKDSKGSN